MVLNQLKLQTCGHRAQCLSMSVSLEGQKYRMEHPADAFIPWLFHKSTMELLTQTTWSFYLNNKCTKAAVSGFPCQWVKSAIQLFSLLLSQGNHPKSMFMNFPKNWHTDIQTNIVKLCQHSTVGLQFPLALHMAAMRTLLGQKNSNPLEKDFPPEDTCLGPVCLNLTRLFY